MGGDREKQEELIQKLEGDGVLKGWVLNILGDLVEDQIAYKAVFAELESTHAPA